MIANGSLVFFLVVGFILVVPGMSQNGGGGGERNDMLGMVTDAMMNIAIGLIEGCRGKQK
ncbi:spider silk-constituting element SpiCE-CMa3 [Caerostris extrusa]|uniref:Spider silk-constituting element SpiCE-CMa3 n=1 Tax=Caerostris extrusa TaxID=172846 RepID=A0AAV4XHV5_CAEEX|nr:spider silk-constituting element SpiCE-CMa3 [Caerostris extrusa]